MVRTSRELELLFGSFSPLQRKAFKKITKKKTPEEALKILGVKRFKVPGTTTKEARKFL